MLLVDERIGSRDLLLPLQRSGVPADMGHLDYADFAFVGRGVDDAPITVGIELKETKDLVSSLRSSRFAGHQLIGLQGYDRAWLITEGIWRAGEEGVLEVMQGGWRPVSLGKNRVMAGDIESWILTQTIRGGLGYWHCPTRRDTLRFISVLYHWWTDKNLAEHRSHQQIYLPPPDRVLLTEPDGHLKMMACLPGVGWDRATKLWERFDGDILKVAVASTEELQETDGIGKGIASKIRNFFDKKES